MNIDTEIAACVRDAWHVRQEFVRRLAANAKKLEQLEWYALAGQLNSADAAARERCANMHVFLTNALNKLDRDFAGQILGYVYEE